MIDFGSPEPPAQAKLDPLLEPLASGAELWRVHRLEHRPTQFNPGAGCGRFHPFPGAGGVPVPTLYAAATWEGAICETIFHDVPLRGPDRRKASAELRIRALSKIRLRRDVVLIDLRSLGLRRLQLRRRELIDTEADQYPRTARWAAALHRVVPAAAGMVWMARLADPAATVFFGDRLAEKDFDLREGPIPLGDGEGLARVLGLAEKAMILITE